MRIAALALRAALPEDAMSPDVEAVFTDVAARFGIPLVQLYELDLRDFLSSPGPP